MEVGGIYYHTLFWVVISLLFLCRIHTNFKLSLQKYLRPLLQSDPIRLHSFSTALAKIWCLNLDPAIPFLKSRYSSLGRPAKFDPIDLLRSLFLMAHMKVFSITQWVQMLRDDAVLAIISGFEPYKTPSVGTFYDFQNRCWLEDRQQILQRRRTPKKARIKPKKKLGSGEKLTPKHPGVVKKLVAQALAGRTLHLRPEKLLQQIFAHCCVDHSIDLGLIHDPNSLILSGDGSSLPTGSNPHGVKNCDCSKQGNYCCSCPRRYSDPDANWGWDRSNENVSTMAIPCTS